jgi:hypothetical protein
VLTPDDRDYLDSLGNRAPGVMKAVQNATACTSWAEGMCLQAVRTWWGIAPGALTAIGAWRAVPTDLRHGFYTPPEGVAVFWGGGAAGDGHVALSLGGGYIRTVSVIGTTNVTTDTLAYPTNVDRNLTYLGWTELLNGYPIYTRG